MRLLITTHYFWPEVFRINDLVAGLQKRGHKLTVLTGKPNYPQGDFSPGYGFFKKATDSYHNAKVIRVPVIPRRRGGALRLIMNYFSFLSLAPLFGLARCRGRYDAVFVYLPSPVTSALPALLYAKLTRTPLVLWVQDLWPDVLVDTGTIKNKFILRLVGYLVRFIYRRSDLILVQSRKFIEDVIQQGADKEKVHYFPNWAESLYKPLKPNNDFKEKRNIPEGFKIIFAGNIGEAQNFNTILSAAEKLKTIDDLQWIILGDGRRKDWVESEIKRRNLGQCVHLLGRFPLEEMPDFFAHADALLVSLKDEPVLRKTIPSKVQSYLASGKPILAALTGEGGEVIKEANAGFVCQSGSSDALVQIVKELYQLSAKDRETMGMNGRLYFEKNFEREQSIDFLEQWLQRLCKESRDFSVRVGDLS